MFYVFLYCFGMLSDRHVLTTAHFKKRWRLKLSQTASKVTVLIVPGYTDYYRYNALNVIFNNGPYRRLIIMASAFFILSTVYIRAHTMGVLRPMPLLLGNISKYRWPSY